jgi:ribonuclease Z
MADDSRLAALADIPRSDCELVFLGTASCTPTASRGVSCIALRCGGATWLFDAGEGTQIQLQKSCVNAGSVTKIFVTHCHGDHSFGLPGLLCLIGAARSQEHPPLEIYGPERLRMFLRASLRLSYSRVLPYVVHELVGVPYMHGAYGSCPTQAPWVALASALQCSEEYGECSHGRDITADANGHWLLEAGSNSGSSSNSSLAQWSVTAAALSHTVPCVGFVLQEPERQGKLRMDYISPILARNAAGLRAAGIRVPQSLLSVIKALAPDEQYAFPDGTVVTGAEATSAPRNGRKIAVLGDTCDSSQGESAVLH